MYITKAQVLCKGLYYAKNYYEKFDENDPITKMKKVIQSLQIMFLLTKINSNK